MQNFTVKLLRDKTNPSSATTITIRATSAREARQKALFQYGINGRIIAVVAMPG